MQVAKSTRNIVVTANQLRPKYDAEKHIQNSRLNTMHFQNALPKLPVPTLKETDEKIRVAVQALGMGMGHPQFQSQQIEEFTKLWDDFVVSDGKKLDKLLKDEDTKNSDTNFVNEPWTQMYLNDRRPLPMNYNPTVVLTDAGQEGARRPDQVRRGAQIIWSTAKFHLTLRDELLKPDCAHLKQEPSKNAKILAKYLPNTRVTMKSKGIENQSLRYLPYVMNNSFPLDMSQYKNLLFSTRIPEDNKDRIQKAPTETRHTAVLYNGRFYKVDAFTENDTVRGQEELLADLAAIISDGDAKGMNPDSICPLSCADRDTWTTARKQLVKLGNTEALDIVDHAMFLLTLDDYSYTSPGNCCKNHYAGPAENRWPDKSIQIVMGKCVSPGVVFEHAWGDGAAVLSYMNHTNHYIEETLKNGTCRITPDLQPSGPGILQEVKFNLDDQVKQAIKNAADYHNGKFAQLECTVAVRGDAPAVHNPQWYDQDAESTKTILKEKLNRKWMTDRKLGADGFMQLGILIAGTTMKGYPVSAYESASTSSFKHGRTECIRPCTIEGQTAAQIYLNGDFTKVETKKKLCVAVRKAIKRHNQQTKQCLGGHGWDRHVFGLRDQAKKHGFKEHPVFATESFKGLFQFPLSTSTLNSDAVSLGAFGPVTEGGYGIGYIVYPTWVGVAISAFKNEADVYGFRDTLYEVWDTMMDAFEHENDV